MATNHGRNIILDTETTGLSPSEGHRVIEIAAVEVIDLVPTGKHLHVYVNPERDVPHEAFLIHGISTDFLRDKPLFSEIAQDFLEFVGNSPIVAHNAEFDFRFLNSELDYLSLPPLKNQMIDSLALANSMFPGSRSTLDALCTRYKIDRSGRVKHGALTDTLLLAQVYLQMKGGRNHNLELVRAEATREEDLAFCGVRKQRAPRTHLGLPSAEEILAHAAFVAATAGKKSQALWDMPAHDEDGPDEAEPASFAIGI